MKAKDIEPGVVYAYRRGKYGTPQPVVFLTAPSPDHLYSQHLRAAPGHPIHQHRPGFGKPQRGQGFTTPDVGYPAVFARGRSQDADLAELAGVTLADFATATSHIDVDRGIQYEVVTSLAHIVGPYAEVVAGEEEAERVQREQRAAERRERQAAQEQTDRVIAALRRHGINAESDDEWRSTAVRIPLADADKILALIGGADAKEKP